MITIVDIKSHASRSIFIKFTINYNYIKKCSKILSELSSSYFTDKLSNEIYIEPEWIESVIKDLNNKKEDKEIEYFILGYKASHISLAVSYIK